MEPIRQFFSYSRSERNGIVVLLMLIAVALSIKTYLYFAPSKEVVLHDVAFEKAIARFESDTLIELNTATKIELTNLSGVGPSFADRIIVYRERLGGFVMKEQLLDVHGVGPAKYSKMQAWISVDSTLVQKLLLHDPDSAALKLHPYLDTTLVKELLKPSEVTYQELLQLSSSRMGTDSLLYRYFMP